MLCLQTWGLCSIRHESGGDGFSHWQPLKILEGNNHCTWAEAGRREGGWTTSRREGGIGVNPVLRAHQINDVTECDRINPLVSGFRISTRAVFSVRFSLPLPLPWVLVYSRLATDSACFSSPSTFFLLATLSASVAFLCMSFLILLPFS